MVEQRKDVERPESGVEKVSGRDDLTETKSVQSRPEA